MSEESLNIIVVEDDALIAALITGYIEDMGHVVVDTVYRANHVLSSVKSHLPDLVLLDINLNDDLTGIDLAHELNKLDPRVPFIYVTAYADATTLSKAKVTRPLSFIVKPIQPQALHSAITVGMYNLKSTTELDRERVDALSSGMLTDKENALVIDLSLGLTNAQLAEKHFVSLNTIKWHLQKIYSKMDVKNRSELISKLYSS